MKDAPVPGPSLSRRLRRRLVHHHLPLAVVTVMSVLALYTLTPARAGDVRSGAATNPAHGQPPAHAPSGTAGGHGAAQAPAASSAGLQQSNAGLDRLASARTGGVLFGGFARPLTLATGYVAVAFLSVTLLIGPWKVLSGRPNPVSLDLRRDMGIWTAIVSVVHVAAGFQVHEGGRILRYFVSAVHQTPLLNAFGLANYAGLAATLIVVFLATLSNDVALRRLRTQRWKNLQRLAYVLAALVATHTVLYLSLTLRERSPLYPVLFGMLAASVVVLQTAGVWMRISTSTRAALAGTVPPAPPVG